MDHEGKHHMWAFIGELHVLNSNNMQPCYIAAQQRYQPLDVFSFMAYQAANAADNSINNRFTGKMGNDLFSNSVLQTGSTRNSAPVQLVQRRFNI